MNTRFDNVEGVLVADRNPEPSSNGGLSGEIVQPRLRIVLPAYNEAEALPLLLKSIRQALAAYELEYLVIVVDDGSADDTAEVVTDFMDDMPVSLVRHERNKGLGQAIKTGFTAAVEESGPHDIIITLDADNSHPAFLIRRLVQVIREGADVAIASRFHQDARVAGVPWDRVLLSLGARWIFRTCFPITGVRDYTCGYRAYRAAVLMHGLRDFGDQFVSESGFSCMVDVLLKLRRRPWVMVEVPLLLRYDQKMGVSKMKVFRTVRQTFSLIGRRLAGR